MIDIQLLRKDIDGVAARSPRASSSSTSPRSTSLEAERKQIQTRTEELQGSRNSLSKQIGMLKGKGEDASARDGGSRRHRRRAEGVGGDGSTTMQAQLQRLPCWACPNLPHETVPVGARRNAATSKCAAGARRARSISR